MDTAGSLASVITKQQPTTSRLHLVHGASARHVPLPAAPQSSAVGADDSGGTGADAQLDKGACSGRKRQRMSDASALRKANKPLMEKRRRARINKSLGQLKGVLLRNTGNSANSALHNKWEKADILEMSVNYIITLQQQLQEFASRAVNDKAVPHVAPEPNSDSKPLQYFVAGFEECVALANKLNNDSLATPLVIKLSEQLEHLHRHMVSMSHRQQHARHGQDIPPIAVARETTQRRPAAADSQHSMQPSPTESVASNGSAASSLASSALSIGSTVPETHAHEALSAADQRAVLLHLQQVLAGQHNAPPATVAPDVLSGASELSLLAAQNSGLSEGTMGQLCAVQSLLALANLAQNEQVWRPWH